MSLHTQFVCFKKLFSELKGIAISMTNNNPDLYEDAFSLMEISVLSNAGLELSYAQLRRRAIWYVIDELFRSKRYMNYQYSGYLYKRIDIDLETIIAPETTLSSFEIDIISSIFWERILDQLTEDEQLIIICNFWGSMAVKEIGSILGVKSSAVIKRRLTAVRKIKEILDGYGIKGTSGDVGNMG